MEQPNDHVERINYLILGYLRQTLTEPEKVELDDWICADTANLLLFEELTDEKNIDQYLAIMKQADKKRILEKITEGKNSISLWRYFAAAAIILVVISVAFLYYKKPLKIITYNSEKQLAIKPGGNKATLTFSDGSTAVLDSISIGLIRKEGDASISKMNDGKLVYAGTADLRLMNTVSTPRGGQYTVILADGTTATLNASSSIYYPVSFTDSIREVAITGEVYFEVAKDKQHPFRVKAGNAGIEVLGTHFNVNAYTDELAIKTTLVEGSVRINGRILSPGEQAMIGQNSGVSVIDVDTSIATAWKNGYFRFKNENIVSIMRQVSRWYDVEIEYVDNTIRNEKFGGIVSRSSSINEVLKVMEATNTIHFKTQNRKIMVTR